MERENRTLSFNGDLYPTAGADVVMTTSGDMVKYESGARKRLGIGSANQILQVKSSLPSWETLSTAGSILTTQGDILYESASGLARLGQSTDGFVLTTKGASANPVWAAGGGGKWETVENHVATGTESTYTFDIDEATDDNSMLVLVYDLGATASFALQMVVNDVTNYNADGSLINAGSQTIINVAGASEIEIASTTILSAGNATACGTVQIFTPDAGTTRPLVLSQATGQNTSAIEFVSSLVVGSATSITKIVVQSSTSTWLANSKFTLYRVVR